MMNRQLVSVLRLGRMSYLPALSVQTKLVTRIQANIAQGRESGNTVVLVEHPPVYTTGMRTREYSEDEERRLRALGADFVRTNRGGLITFHGPGQLVAYPILNLRDFAPEAATRKSLLGMKWYINTLEQIIIDLCQDYGVTGTRSPHTGVWVGNNKICAMGVHNSNLVTSHGLALNCNTDLAWFRNIVPCGIHDAGVTSLSEELCDQVTIEEASEKFLEKFSDAFQCDCKTVISDDETILSNPL